MPAVVLMAATAILTSLSFSARTAEVASKLMHDVETNPGPNCSGGGCPGAGKLGFQSGVLHANTSLDPLERLSAGSTYTFGGVQRYITSMATAIQAFIDLEYPDVGGEGLKIVPDLPSPQDGITWEDVSKHCVAERHGGLVQGHPVLHQNLDPAKKRLLDELVKKYRGDEGERLAVLPLLEWLEDKDATVILGQKNTLELFHQQMEQELSGDLLLPIDKKIAVVEKVAESVGLNLDISAIELEVNDLLVKYVGQLGTQSVAAMKNRLQSLSVPQGLNRHEKQHWRKTLAMLNQILDDNSRQPNLDMFNHIKHELVVKKLNKNKKEKDIIFVKPHHKTIGHVEVKAMTDLQNHEVLKALDQLKGGKEEMLRVHGHLLDSDWSYLGIICLPNLPQNLKQTMCTSLNICSYCADYILASDANTEMKSHLNTHFSSSTEFPDVAVQDQYKKITSRLLAMQHLCPPVSTVQRMAGREREVVPAFTEGDHLPDLSTASVDKIKAWKKEKHLGSPTSILFFTQEQLRLWDEKRVLLMADYSTGKTTLLKSKAASLARAGESVTLIFLGGSGKTEAVMSIANKLDFDPIKYPNVTVLSQQDLEEKYRQEHPWRPWLPSPLSLVKFYIEKEKPQHLMVDEVPFDKSTWKQLLTLQNWIFAKLMSYFGGMGIIIYGAICFLLFLLTWHFGGIGWFAITLGVLLAWLSVGDKFNPLNLDKTGSLLNSLPPLLSPSSSSSFLWLAMHSSPLTDTTDGGTLSKENLENWRRRLSQTFTIPTLQNNLRNSNEVASARGLLGGASLSSDRSVALPSARAPRPLPTLPPTPICLPIYLPLYSTSQLGEAVHHVYVTSLEEPGTLVVLLDDLNQQDVVKTTLTQAGLTVVTYTKPTERTSCEKFVENPKGALVTTPQLFSGMEAANVLWVKDPTKAALQRSNQLRAIHKLCIIDTTSNFHRRTPVSTGFKVDGTFAKCHKIWFGKLYWCKSCDSQPILICNHCAAVCHTSCETEWASFRTVLHLILQYNPCSCETSGSCKLKPPTRMSPWLALATIIFITIAVSGVFDLFSEWLKLPTRISPWLAPATIIAISIAIVSVLVSRWMNNYF